jgi:hypothetical protein
VVCVAEKYLILKWHTCMAFLGKISAFNFHQFFMYTRSDSHNLYMVTVRRDWN